MEAGGVGLAVVSHKSHGGMALWGGGFFFINQKFAKNGSEIQKKDFAD